MGSKKKAAKPVKKKSGVVKKVPVKKKAPAVKKKVSKAPEPRAAERAPKESTAATEQDLHEEVESIGDGTEEADFDDDEVPPEVDEDDDEGYF